MTLPNRKGCLLGCPLCFGTVLTAFFSDAKREYWRCQCCQLVFVLSDFHLCAAAEKSYYDLHENNPLDEGYRRFLNRLCEPLSKRLPSRAYGLDFGSGPGPALSVMFAEHGFEMELFDIFYAPDQAVLKKTYNFVTATEVVEHLSQPRAILEQLWSLILPGGYLGLMTKLVRNREAFASWHYKNDPTHITFFNEASFRWLADQWRVEVEFIGSDVILLHKCSIIDENKLV